MLRWQQQSGLLVFVLLVASKKRILSKFCILSCFVSLKSVLLNLLCVSDIFFFQNAGSGLCFRFFFFHIRFVFNAKFQSEIQLPRILKYGALQATFLTRQYVLKN